MEPVSYPDESVAVPDREENGDAPQSVGAQVGAGRRRWSPLLDIVLVGAVFLTGLGLAWQCQKINGDRLSAVHGDWFVPSVMWATGHGFRDARWQDIPELKAFLDQERPDLPAGSLPAEVKTTPCPKFQLQHRYAFLSVGLVWRWFGVNWAALRIWVGIILGLAGVAAYLFFRSGMGRVPAGLLALVFLFAPSTVSMIPHFRDISKAPFILAVLALLAFLARTPQSGRRLIALSALLGLIMGIGYGFRMDLLVCLAPAGGVLLLFLPGRPSWRQAVLRAAACAVMFACFAATSWPVYRERHNTGDTTFHNINGGLTDRQNNNLGLGGADYACIPLFHDGYIYDVVSDYAMRNGLVAGPILCQDPKYNQAGKAYFLKMIDTFPADMFVRGLVTVPRVLQDAGTATTPDPFRGDSTAAKLSLRTGRPLWAFLYYCGPVLVLLAVLSLLAADLRLGLAAAFVLLFFAGYPVLQYEYRHIFHLGVLTLWPIGFLVAQAGRGAMRLREQGRTCFAAWNWQHILPPLARMAVPLGLVAAVSAVIYGVALNIQGGYLKELRAQYRSAQLDPLPVQEDRAQSTWDWVFLRADQASLARLAPFAHPEFPVRSRYLAAEFQGHIDNYMFAEAYAIQRPEISPMDQTHYFVNPCGKPSADNRIRCFFPVFESTRGYSSQQSFAGIRIPRGLLPYFTGLYVVRNANEFPLELVLDITQDADSHCDSLLDHQRATSLFPGAAMRAQAAKQ